MTFARHRPVDETSGRMAGDGESGWAHAESGQIRNGVIIMARPEACLPACVHHAFPLPPFLCLSPSPVAFAGS
jgi:hypothetical protein